MHPTLELPYDATRFEPIENMIAYQLAHFLRSTDIHRTGAPFRVAVSVSKRRHPAGGGLCLNDLRQTAVPPAPPKRDIGKLGRNQVAMAEPLNLSAWRYGDHEDHKVAERRR